MKSLVSIISVAAFAAGCTSVHSPTPPTAQPVVQATPEFYILKPGDTGAKVAAAHELTLADLLAMNPRVEWARLKVGQSIRIRPEK